MLEINSKLPSTLFGITPEWVEENPFITTRDKGLLLVFLGVFAVLVVTAFTYLR